MAGKQLNIVFAADSSQVGTAFSKMESQSSSFGEKLSGVGARLSAVVTLPLAALGAKAFTMAADAEDATSAMNVVFGKSADVIEQWSKDAATSMGLTSTEAKKAATDLAIFGKAGGLAGKDLTDFATQQSQLSADLASFKGTSVEEAMTAIGAAYRGEMEPIRAYGVLLDAQKIKEEALTLGLVKEGDELTNNAKLMATRSLIMKATADQQGDFERTSDGAANKMKILSAQIKEQATAIGAQLIPIGQKLLGVVSGWLTKFNEMGPAGQQMVLVIGGIAMAAGPVLFIVGKLIPAIGGLVKAFQAVIMVMRLVQLLFVANPFGLLIMAIVALVAIVIANWDTIKSAIGAAWEWIRATTTAVWSAMTAYLSGVWNALKTGVTVVWNVIQAIVSAAVNAVSSRITAAWNAVRNVTSSAWAAIQAVMSAAWNAITSGVTSAFQRVRDAITGAINTARSNVAAAINAIKSAFQSLMDKVRAVVNFINSNFQKLAFWRHSPSLMEQMAARTIQGVNRSWDLLTAPEMFDPTAMAIGVGGQGGGVAGNGGVSGGGPTTIEIRLDRRVIGEVVDQYFKDKLRDNPRLIFQTT